MQPTEFLQRFVHSLRDAVPADYRQFETRYMGGLVKVYYDADDPGVHYELALRNNGYIELGLHFESSKETNDRLLRYFGERGLDVVSELGPQVEIEQWTRTWGRVHQTMPYRSPDETALSACVKRMSEMIAVLQPMLEEA